MRHFKLLLIIFILISCDHDHHTHEDEPVELTDLTVHTTYNGISHGGSVPIYENDGIIDITATLNRITDLDVEVDLEFFGGDAINTVDYNSPTKIIIPAGNISASIEFKAEDNSILNPRKVVGIKAINASNVDYIEEPHSSAIYILDNEEDPIKGVWKIHQEITNGTIINYDNPTTNSGICYSNDRIEIIDGNFTNDYIEVFPGTHYHYYYEFSSSNCFVDYIGSPSFTNLYSDNMYDGEGGTLVQYSTDGVDEFLRQDHNYPPNSYTIYKKE